MKLKTKIAIILAVVGACVLVGVMLWAFLGSNNKPDNQQESSQQQNTDGGELQTPTAPEENKVPSVPEQTPTVDESDKPEEPKEEEKPNEQPKQEETPSKKPTVNEAPEAVTPPAAGKLNADPKTKEEIEAVLNDPYMILVNRSSRVSSDYVGSNLVTYSGDYKLNSTCADALRKLIRAGKNAGYNYVLYSGYRSYSSQYNKYYNKIAYWENQGKSKEEAIRLTDQYYAPPGASEHHTGLAADVCVPEIVNKYACLHENYEYTDAFKWFSAHAHEYGFILRYPKGDEDITGYNYEPWHYRYVGVDIATEIHRRNITFEEYVSDLKQRLSALGE